ncbi:hypothetical protein JW964_18105 [candidate division KSB1 bacterium]|nr:hypothetical protein [candidate division KSB1 bacterium]
MKLVKFLVPGLLLFALLWSHCNIKPADPGIPADNQVPTTILPNVPPDGSMGNSFKKRLQWHGNDADGIIVGYDYKLDGPLHKEKEYRLYKNEWINTKYHYADLKFQNGWYKLWVRAIDNKGAKDLTPDSISFHVTGPTFDRGILLVDDDQTTNLQNNESDRNKDAAYRNLLEEAGFTNFTEWDYEAMFGLTGKPVFVDSAIDSTGSVYYGLSAYSTIIWYTAHDAKDHIFKLESLFIDYLEMGGNLWISGVQPIFSITGKTPNGMRFSESSFSRKYLRIQSADTVQNEVDLLLSVADNYPDLPTSKAVTKTKTVFAGHYIWSVDGEDSLHATFNQLIPEPDADPLYVFSSNVYEYLDGNDIHYINSEEYARTSCAVRYVGNNYRAFTFGFPLIRIDRRNDIIDHDAMVSITRQILGNEFLEQP